MAPQAVDSIYSIRLSKYSQCGVAYGTTDRIRLLGWPAPLLVFLYTLIGQRCILDGWPGWLYVLQRMLAETLIAVEIVDRLIRKLR